MLAGEVFKPRLRRGTPDPGEINALAHALGKRTGLRITVIAPEGTVLAESNKSPEELSGIENHLHRPEVQEAIRNGTGSAIRHSDTISVDLLYVAVALRQEKLIGVVRGAMPLHDIERTTGRVHRIVATSSGLVALAVVPLLFWMARRAGRPIEQMRRMAIRVAEGDFSVKAPVDAVSELGELGGALNRMAEQLETRLKQLIQEQTELRITLASMTEGVLLVDGKERILLANQALLRLFKLSGEIVGQTIMEAFRNISLHEMIRQSMEGREVRDRELSFWDQQERIFAINVARLRTTREDSIGAVIVFHEITRLKQLENLRKEVVANVSHELRTPLSIIKGYLETLLEQPPPPPETARQFLQTIQRHSNRLETLINDLLTISALESPQEQIDFKPLALRPVVDAVVEELTPPARSKSISVQIDIPPDLPAIKGEGDRLHQALLNLLNNAIKYTQPGGQATVSARANEGQVEVCVSDNGPGIAPEHLPHLFERFYRVDKARSRDVGGTGLGLSIVKHIIQVHGGRVWAESEPRKGSRFYFVLPAARAAD